MQREGVGHLQQAGLILLLIAVIFTALNFIKKWHKSLILHLPLTDYNQQSVVSSGCSRVVLALRYKDERREDNNIINAINDAEMNFNVIDSHRIILGTKIGQGQFGQLFRGFYITNDHEGQTVMQSVALKVIGRTTRDQLTMRQAKIIAAFNHPNIIAIRGIVENRKLIIVIFLSELYIF